MKLVIPPHKRSTSLRRLRAKLPRPQGSLAGSFVEDQYAPSQIPARKARSAAQQLALSRRSRSLGPGDHGPPLEHPRSLPSQACAITRTPLLRKGLFRRLLNSTAKRQPCKPKVLGSPSPMGAFWHVAATDDFAFKIEPNSSNGRGPGRCRRTGLSPRGLFAAASTTACRCVSLASSTKIVWIRMPSWLYLPLMARER